MKYKLSIVICCYGKLQFTKYTINELSYLPKDEVEIIVIDNSSDTITKNYLQTIHNSNMRFIFNTENKWHSGGSNQGYAASTGERILFLNNDIKITDSHNWHNHLIREIDNNPNAIVGPTGGFINPKKDFQFCYETLDNSKQINYISGWCLGARREIFEQLTENGSAGPWNENFFYFNDGDLSYRASQQNIELKLIKLPIQHIGKISSQQLNIGKLYNDGRKKFASKWRNRV